MSEVVLDAAALLALLNKEPAADKLTPQLLSTATSSTVNLTVQTKLVRWGVPPNEAWTATLAPIREAAPFTAEHARLAGALVAQTRALGLSLGDRACLALALTLKAPVYTTDKTWKSLRLGIPIYILR
jgi:ribonuclease VapC